MAFRDHPLMTRRSGMKTWPPLWTSTRTDKTDWPKGEVGMLREAWLHDGLDTCLFLFMEYNYPILATTFGGIVRPICLAVFGLITNSNLVGCSTGKSPGFAP